jgi:hypothetical protein
MDRPIQICFVANGITDKLYIDQNDNIYDYVRLFCINYYNRCHGDDVKGLFPPHGIMSIDYNYGVCVCYASVITLITVATVKLLRDF